MGVGLSDRAKLIAAVVVGVLYAVGMLIAGRDMVPGTIGAVLAGVLCFLVLREIERRRARRGS